MEHSETMTFDALVVLSLGMVPAWKPDGLCSLSTGSDGFIHTVKPKIAPTLTDMEGVFVTGAAAGPKDIVDSIAEAGAASMEASRYLAALAGVRKTAAA
jgi:heterodisulfide reductase subunit A